MRVQYFPLPGPGRYIPWRDLQAIRHSPLQALQQIAQQYGDIFQYPVGFWTIYFLNHPDYIRYVLQDHQRNYTKDTFQYHLLSSVAGRGLLTNDGPSWLQQRRLAQPAFHRHQLALLGANMTAAATSLIERWHPFAKRGEPLDIDAEMMRLTLQIVGTSLFGIDLSGQAERLVQAVLVALDSIIHRAQMPFALPSFVPTARNRRFRAALQELDAAVYAIIGERRKRGEQANDLLGMLMSTQDEENGEKMSDQHLRDELITLLIAGHETVASALTWTWYFLAISAEVEQKFSHELSSVLGGRLPTIQDLPDLSYTRMIFDESLRFYPPAWMITRRSLAEDQIGGYRIPAGSLIVVSPYVTHRHPAFWERAHLFEPERFANEGTATRPRFAYFPFGGGPRLCIGNHYSLMEGQLILATIAQHYRLYLLPNRPVEVVPLVTLRPKHGLWMRASVR